MDWQEKYRKKLISAEEAAGMIASGDKVVVAPGSDPPAITAALAARKAELRDIEIIQGSPPYHKVGWYEPGDEESFLLNICFAGSLARQMLDARRADFSPFIFSAVNKAVRDLRPERKQWDWLMQVVSPPDRYGYCSYGNQIWWRKSMKDACKKVVCEVDANQIRTYGENYIHVSEIDYFVEHTSPRIEPLLPLEISEHSQAITDYISTLVRDGDTIQLGTGTATDPIALLGAFDNKHDLGVHAEMTTHGTVDLVKRGVITGKCKTVHPGKVVTTCVWPEPGALDYADMNPVFELYDISYVNDVRVISAHDNMVAINNAMAIDLTGQIAVESIGPRIWSAPGGQLEFAMGAMYSRGGRYIAALPSTVSVRGKTLSRIVPQLQPGSYVGVPRSLADYVVTEFGIARLMNKSQRERANELISVAHPNFRSELREAAKRLFYP